MITFAIYVVSKANYFFAYEFRRNPRNSTDRLQSSFHFPKSLAWRNKIPLSNQKFFTSRVRRDVAFPAVTRRDFTTFRAKSKGHYHGEIGNDRHPVDSRGIQKPSAGITAGGPRSLVWCIRGWCRERVKSPVEEGAGSCPLPDRLPATLKSARRRKGDGRRRSFVAVY